MKEVNRKVSILWKYNPNAFEIINKDILGGDSFRKIGSSISAVNAMLEQNEMLSFLMPSLLGVSPDSKDVNWERTVRHYWDSLSVDVPLAGYNLETGFKFNINDLRRKAFISKLVKDTDIKTDAQLATYVMGYNGTQPNVEEEEKWKYGQPIDIEQYLIWRYVLNYKHVANNPDDVNKSPNIRFFLHTEEERQRAKKEKFKVKKNALDRYMKFMKDASGEDVNDLLAVLTPDSIVDIVKNPDFEDKQMKIMDIVNEQPNKFVNTISDKSLAVKAVINKLMAFGVLKQLPGSSAIVDASDASVIVGNSLDQAVTFFNNEKNKSTVSEFMAKYKSLINK